MLCARVHTFGSSQGGYRVPRRKINQVSVFKAFQGVNSFAGFLVSLLGSPRSSSVLLGSPRFSSVLLGSLLGSPRFSSVLLGSPRFSPRFSSVLLGSPRFSSVLLGSPGSCWALPGRPGRVWPSILGQVNANSAKQLETARNYPKQRGVPKMSFAGPKNHRESLECQQQIYPAV